jgi:hygromycin-B 4-O-kinase
VTTPAETFLIGRFGSAISNVSRIAHGEWSEAYAYRHGGTEYVIRFSPLAEDFLKDRRAAAHNSAELPIPPVIELGEALGGYYAIAERVPGLYLDDLDGQQMGDALASLFETLDAARRIDVSASTGYGEWGADGNAAHPTWRAALLDVVNDRPSSRTHGWRQRLADSSIGLAAFDEAAALLQTLVEACPEERHLIHSDLLNYNVLVADGRITGVLDWGCSMYGDFLYDVAWFAYWAPVYPRWQGIDFAHAAQHHYAAIGLDVPHFEERLRCYQTHIGLGDLAYSSYKGRWAELPAKATRALEVARP